MRAEGPQPASPLALPPRPGIPRVAGPCPLRSPRVTSAPISAPEASPPPQRTRPRARVRCRSLSPEHSIAPCRLQGRRPTSSSHSRPAMICLLFRPLLLSFPPVNPTLQLPGRAQPRFPDFAGAVRAAWKVTPPLHVSLSDPTTLQGSARMLYLPCVMSFSTGLGTLRLKKHLAALTLGQETGDSEKKPPPLPFKSVEEAVRCESVSSCCKPHLTPHQGKR